MKKFDFLLLHFWVSITYFLYTRNDSNADNDDHIKNIVDAIDANDVSDDDDIRNASNPLAYSLTCAWLYEPIIALDSDSDM